MPQVPDPCRSRSSSRILLALGLAIAAFRAVMQQMGALSTGILFFYSQLTIFSERFIDLKGSDTERSKDRDLYPLHHSSNSCNGWTWARPKPGAWDSIQVSPVIGKAQVPGPSSHPFWGALAGNWTIVCNGSRAGSGSIHCYQLPSYQCPSSK